MTRNLVPASLKLFAFDWDGTLQDCAEATLHAYEVIFQEVGIPLKRSDFLAHYSPNWYRTYEALGLPAEKYEWADRRWLELFIPAKRGLLPGVREILAELRKRGFQVALLTAAAPERLYGELRHYCLEACFDWVLTMEEYHVRKPDPTALRGLLERSGKRPEETIYVGDAVEDVEMGRAAGTYTLAIPSAFVRGKALRKAEPDFMVERIEQIIGLIPKSEA
jgi:HAD superfamily hydrolase (TIGR01509 family)